MNESADHLYSIGWTVTLICVLFSAWVALRYLKHHPRLFTVMALYVCSWMLVLGTYANRTETSLSGLAGDVASFLEIYIGGLLVLEGQNQKGRAQTVSWPQSAGLTLLLFIALPRAIDFPAPLLELTNHYLGLTHLTPQQTQAIASLGLTLIGFLAVAIGVAHIANMRTLLFGIFAANLLFYSALQIGDTLNRWSVETDMTAPYIFGFAAAKLVQAIAFGLIIRKRACSLPQPAYANVAHAA